MDLLPASDPRMRINSAGTIPNILRISPKVKEKIRYI